MIDTSQSALLPLYAELISTVEIRAAAAIEAKKIADRIIRNLSSYQNIQLKTGIPWWWIASIHSLECDLNFSQHLANGDPIDRPTIHEPIGIPAGTWEECAIAALKIKPWLFSEVDWGNPLSCIYAAERYNGLGYWMYRTVRSPYVWGGTSHYTKGKYTADGVWSDTAVSEQVGFVAIWMALGIDLQPPQIAENISISVSDVNNLGENMRTNFLVDVAEYYDRKPHQIAALQWLQSQTPDGVLDKFKDEYSPSIATSGSVAMAPIVSDTTKFSTDFATEQYKILCQHAKSGVANLATKTSYYSQRDNYTQSQRTCNSSASAMLLDWWLRASGQEGLGGDDEYLRRLLAIGGTIYHENQTALIEQYGFKSTWLDSDVPTQTDFDRVDGLLDNGFPVTVNISHRGTNSAPTGGHVILLIARRKSEGTYIANDPYGTLSSGYENTNGRFSLISRSSFRARWQGGHRVLV
jgi:lysozyme family protein